MEPSGWVDLALLGSVLLSVLVGLWRGLVFELLSLLGWVAAYIAAQAFASTVAAYLPVGAPGSALNLGAAFALVFLAALIVWSIAARLVRLLIHATPLSVVDRLLGGVFGALRGVVLLLALVTVVSMTPAQRAPAWQASIGVAWLRNLLQHIKPVLPDSVGRHLPA